MQERHRRGARRPAQALVGEQVEIDQLLAERRAAEEKLLLLGERMRGVRSQELVVARPVDRVVEHGIDIAEDRCGRRRCAVALGEAAAEVRREVGAA